MDDWYYLRLVTTIINMQKGIFRSLVLLITVISVVSCSSSKHAKIKRLPGTWQASPVTIDGSDKDWPSPYPEYDDKAMIAYAVSNDKDNLYITMETGDLATALKILHEGLTVWIDRKGEKAEETAINYPIPMSHESGGERQPRQRSQQDGQQGFGEDQQQKKRMELEEKVRAALGSAREYSLQGFKSCNLQFPITELDSCGVQVSINIDSTNELIWEAKVPFKSFYFKSQVARSDKGKPITVCFETTAMERPAGSGGGGGNNGSGSGFRPSIGFGGGMGMGMGMGMGGGGMHRGGGRNSQANDIMEPAYKSTKTYKKIGIAYQD